MLTESAMFLALGYAMVTLSAAALNHFFWVT